MAKVGDFGMARDVSENDIYTKTSAVSTYTVMLTTLVNCSRHSGSRIWPQAQLARREITFDHVTLVLKDLRWIQVPFVVRDTAIVASDIH